MWTGAGDTIPTMSPLDRLHAADLSSVMLAYRDVLRSHQDELNRLNVYPVPDGDTGTNMYLTMEAVAQALDECATLAETCAAISHGSLMGARGNSGVISSQILRGIAEVCALGAPGRPVGEAVVGIAELAVGLRRASDAAYEAVLRPVEGTILTVVRCVAEAGEAIVEAQRRGESIPLVDAVERMRDVARAAVARTPEQLPILKEAGVVDAGGSGFALLFDALLTVIDGRALPEPALPEPGLLESERLGGPGQASKGVSNAPGASELRYEVMFLLEAPDSTIQTFKSQWSEIGDSIVVVGGDGLWNCHIHTNDIGPAIEAGVGAGRPMQIRVTDLIEESGEPHGHPPTPAPVGSAGVGPSTSTWVATAVVAVATGEGLRRLLMSLGVQAVVAGGQSMNPSTAEILEAVKTCSAGGVLILPNNKNIVGVARQAGAVAEVPADVLPTVSILEGLAALVAYEPSHGLEANIAAMSTAARNVRTGEVTQAVRDSVTEPGSVAIGDWIALDRDGVRVIAPTAVDAAIALVDILIDDDSELVTVLTGADVRPEEVARLESRLRNANPSIEVEIREGGQPLYPFLIGVE